jgi:hypothetical protein
MNRDKYYRSLTFWSLGLKYLHLTKVTAEQIVENRNQMVATWWGKKTPEEEAAELDRQTKWSDSRLVEPLLFNLFHGLELVLKGFILFRQTESRKLDHGLTELLSSFRTLYPAERELAAVFGRYVDASAMPALLREFLRANSATVDSYYQLFRYPFNPKFTKEHDHFKLKYKGSRGLPFYRDLLTDLKGMPKIVVALGRSLEQDSEPSVGR